MNYSHRFYDAHGVVIAVWARGRLVMVEHSYKPGLCLPGGGMKRQEDMFTSALRELNEELGQTLAQAVESAGLRHVATRQLVNRRGTNHFFECFLDFEPILKIDGREIIHAEFIAPELIDRSKCDRFFRLYLDIQTDKWAVAS